MLKILPILIPKNKYPNCWSGSLNISPITLNVEYSIKNKIDKYPVGILVFLNNKFIIINNDSPSNNAS